MRQRACVVVSVAAFLAVAVGALAVEAELPKPEKAEKGWVQLFNGKDLKGWKAEGSADWKVENGMLVGRQGQPGNKPGDLFTEKSFDNFQLEVTYKCTWPCNSGVWFRYQKPELAYQADILEWKTPEAYSGTLYSPNLPKGQVFLSANLDKTIEKRDDWNTMRILAQGDHLVVYLNGKKTAEAKDNRIPSGKIGFQVHPGDQFAPMSIMVKEIKILPIKKAAGKEKPASK